MIASARRHWYRVYSWCTAGRPAVICAISGGVLALTTFAIALFNAVGLAEVIALALASAAITITGLINCLIADSRTAWRRGFKLGFRMGMVAERDDLPTDGIDMPARPSQLGVHNAPQTARQGTRG